MVGITDGNRIVVIGASAGGVAALRRLVARFEVDWPMSVFVTLHIGKSRSVISDILNWNSPLPARFAEHEQIFGRGIYIAPPDRHLIVGDTKIFLSAGPTENHSRPAIDPMFRSAASHHGERVIGVLLTGYLYDGITGLHEVQRRGGSTIVQHPSDAEVSDMPSNALILLKPDYVLPLAEIPNAISKLLQSEQRSVGIRSRS